MYVLMMDPYSDFYAVTIGWWLLALFVLLVLSGDFLFNILLFMRSLKHHTPYTIGFSMVLTCENTSVTVCKGLGTIPSTLYTTRQTIYGNHVIKQNVNITQHI